MSESSVIEANVILLPNKKKKPRKIGLNKNHKGSVRSINCKLYVDFMYLDERVREKSGLDDTKENLRLVRQQLDRIIVAIEAGTFRFAEVFPQSLKKEHFKDREGEVYGLKKTPGDVNFGEYVWEWYGRLRDSGRVSQRTLFGYKSYINLYLIPFFGKKAFAELDINAFEKFIIWTKGRCLKDKPISNETINKIFVPLKMICTNATNEFRWVGYNPFFSFKRLPQGDAYEKIMPFTIDEQKILIEVMPDHWKPYFLFAFCSGLRQGEQIGLKPDDIDLEKQVVHIRRAITRDEDGKKIEGLTKNKYSRRSIKMTAVMHRALTAQKAIYEKFKGEYFFCSPEGNMVHPPNLRRRVWVPALEKAKLQFREMKQTRHTFATIALSCGENPLWIAKIMGHRDTNMIIKIYSKYVEDAFGSKDGTMINSAYQCAMSKEE